MSRFIAKYSTSCFDYTIAEDNFTKIVMKKEAKISMNAVIELREALNGYWENLDGKSRLLADIREMKSISRDVREFVSKPNNEVFKTISAIAILVRSWVSKMIASFFLGFNKPKFPVKIFESEEEAVKWLETFKEKTESADLAVQF